MNWVVVTGVYVVMSVVTFAVYGADKASAQHGGRRVPEAQLHLLSLLGGWPGALTGRLVFRHKTRKQPFRTVFWLTVAVNVAVLMWVGISMARTR